MLIKLIKMGKLTSSNNVKAVKESMKDKLAKVKKQSQSKTIKKDKPVLVKKSSTELLSDLLQQGLE